jgi:hypothetical protein
MTAAVRVFRESLTTTARKRNTFQRIDVIGMSTVPMRSAF